MIVTAQHLIVFLSQVLKSSIYFVKGHSVREKHFGFVLTKRAGGMRGDAPGPFVVLIFRNGGFLQQSFSFKKGHTAGQGFWSRKIKDVFEAIKRCSLRGLWEKMSIIKKCIFIKRLIFLTGR